MVRAVIDIVNSMRYLTKDTALTESEYDSSQESDVLQIKETFNLIYSYLVSLKKDDFRYEHDLTTVASQKAYLLPIVTNYLSSVTEVRLISSTKGASKPIYYQNEFDVKSQYPNPDVDVEEGEINFWWINQGSTAGTKELRFLNTPNNAYLIRFYLNSVPSLLTGGDSTGCSQDGDEWLKLKLTADILSSRGFDNSLYLNQADLLLNKYIGVNLHGNSGGKFYEPSFLLVE